jgi:16S rRNA G1207 methylase RsmC
MDPYYKKDIAYIYKGEKLVFQVSQMLFSSFAIDHGTDMLLRHIVLKSPQTILDMGCGYGPIGISLAKANPDSEVTMVDADLLAVRYTKRNIEKNHLTNAQVLGSVGMEAVLDQTYDLIVSNVPAKIGDEAIIQDFILAPLEHLNPNGELWIVIVNGLNRLIPMLKTKHNLSITLVRKRTGHSLYKIQKK